ncbi:hypothetical protein JYU34_004413 [Plutella xylostella]|uniref:Uncharacterized protein n=1 Tax=Plutella xylostella TaxID=51655 RepID=A0ABQ7QY21_PLUXY|nr:hypothetical protein JYU34_004413 [Plutella xylostella]
MVVGVFNPHDGIADGVYDRRAPLVAVGRALPAGAASRPGLLEICETAQFYHLLPLIRQHV